MEASESATAALKIEIQRIPLKQVLGSRDQARLAFAIWQMRGAAERAFLADWFHATLPFVTSSDGLEDFLREVEKEGRSDTSSLLAAIVDDARFNQVGWKYLARILEMLNRGLTAPLVDRRIIYNVRPTSSGRDQQPVLAEWRVLLRQHFRTIQ